MKEKINNEYNIFETVYKGLNTQLITLILADIMGSTIEIKDGKKDYTNFDKLVEQLKDFLDNGVKETPSIDINGLITLLKNDIDTIDNMTKECEYSMRTLSWIKDDLLKDEEGVE